EMNLREYPLRVVVGIRRFTKRDGVVVVLPALHLQSTIGFRLDVERRRFGFGDGALLGLHDGAAVAVEVDVQIGATLDRLAAGDGHSDRMPMRKRARCGREGDCGPDDDANNRKQLAGIHDAHLWAYRRGVGRFGQEELAKNLAVDPPQAATRIWADAFLPGCRTSD